MPCDNSNNVKNKKRSVIHFPVVEDEVNISAAPINQDDKMLSARVNFQMKVDDGRKVKFWLRASSFIHLYDEAEEDEQEASGPVKASVVLGDDDDYVQQIKVNFCPTSNPDAKPYVYTLNAEICDQIREMLRQINRKSEALRRDMNEVVEAGEHARLNGFTHED